MYIAVPDKTITTSFEDLFTKSQQEGYVLKISFADKSPLVVLVVSFDTVSITVEPYSLYGVPISPVRIVLSDIKRAALFQIKYDDPTYIQIREARIAADAIRTSFKALHYQH